MNLRLLALLACLVPALGLAAKAEDLSISLSGLAGRP